MKQIVTLTGPSLSGKTTLMRRLQSLGGFKEIISHTTRPIRAKEANGVDYHFVTEQEFDSIDMVESVTYGDYRYGVAKTSVEVALESGQIPIIILEPNGVSQFAEVAPKYGWDLFKVFVNISPRHQEMRFVDRMFSDVNNSWEPYRERFQLMRQEQAWQKAHRWDLFVNTFGPDNEKGVLLALINRLRRPDLQGSIFQYGRAASVDA